MNLTQRLTRRQFTLIAATAAGVVGREDEPRARLLAVLRKHLDALLLPDGTAVPIKGKDGAALTAMCFEQIHGVTGDLRYRRAAMQLADGVLASMKAMPAGVLAIKEKGQEGVLGGGPPAFGWYTAILGHIYGQAGRRDADIKYLAGVLDRFAWNPKGWWSAAVDVRDGRSVVGLDKPSPVNKNAAMVMACGALSECVAPLDRTLAGNLRAKARKCLHDQIVPAQQADGYWHYGLTERDPNNKDILGYFMLTTGLLIRLQKLAPSCWNPAVAASVRKAEGFAAKHIVPMTAPFTSAAVSPRTTPATPSRYDSRTEPKRGFQLAVLLAHGKYSEEAEKIINYALDCFPHGDRGQEGAKCANDAAAILTCT